MERKSKRRNKNSPLAFFFLEQQCNKAETSQIAPLCKRSSLESLTSISAVSKGSLTAEKGENRNWRMLKFLKLSSPNKPTKTKTFTRRVRKMTTSFTITWGIFTRLHKKGCALAKPITFSRFNRLVYNSILTPKKLHTYFD